MEPRLPKADGDVRANPAGALYRDASQEFTGQARWDRLTRSLVRASKDEPNDFRGPRHRYAPALPVKRHNTLGTSALKPGKASDFGFRNGTGSVIVALGLQRKMRNSMSKTDDRPEVLIEIRICRQLQTGGLLVQSGGKVIPWPLTPTRAHAIRHCAPVV